MRELLVSFEASIWPQVSAIIFAVMFVILMIWVLIPARKSIYKRAENLPFEE